MLGYTSLKVLPQVIYLLLALDASASKRDIMTSTSVTLTRKGVNVAYGRICVYLSGCKYSLCMSKMARVA